MQRVVAKRPDDRQGLLVQSEGSSGVALPVEQPGERPKCPDPHQARRGSLLRQREQGVQPADALPELGPVVPVVPDRRRPSAGRPLCRHPRPPNAMRSGRSPVRAAAAAAIAEGSLTAAPARQPRPGRPGRSHVDGGSPSASPAASSFSSANSRITWSVPNRASPSALGMGWIRLMSASAVRPSSVSIPSSSLGLQIASAASIAQPPANTASRSSRRRSGPSRRS